MNEERTTVKSTYQKHKKTSRNRQALARKLTFRPFRYDDHDYERAVAIENAIEPQQPTSVASWRHRDEARDPRYIFERLVTERDGAIVAVAAYGHTPWSHQPGKFFVYVTVDPTHQKQGIGSAVYDHVLQQLQSLSPRKLTAFTRENRPRAIRFLQKRGFRQVMRIPVSRLDSATFDASRFAGKVNRVLDSGITIKTMRQLSEEDERWKEKLYELEWQCLQDVPSPDPFTKQSFEQFEKRTLGSPSLLPEAWFVALDGERYVGLSVLWRNLASDRLLETGLTGVLRSHRRRSIATALKVRAIQFAQEYGNALIETDNEENNPMFQLNLKLGFVPQPAYLDFEKQVQS